MKEEEMMIIHHNYQLAAMLQHQEVEFHEQIKRVNTIKEVQSQDPGDELFDVANGAIPLIHDYGK